MIPIATYDHLRWQVERERCAADPVYLAETYLRVVAKDEMGHDVGRPALILSRVQRHVLEVMEDQWRRTGFVRLLIGKCRQAWISTLCRLLAFHQVAFQRNRNALLVTHDEPSSLVMFRAFDKAWLDDLPEPLRPVSRIDKRDAIECRDLKTRSIANHALNQNVGASQMTHFLHYSEATRVTRTADDVWSALLPSLSQAKSPPGGAFLRDHSIGVIESTSRYGGDWFKAVADAAKAGTFSDWEFIFIPWPMVSAYSQPVPSTFEITAEEQELKRKHPELSDGNLVWRRGMKETFRANPLSWYTEFPLSWEESWILPEGVDRTFGPDICAELRLREDGKAIRPGVRCEVGRPSPRVPSGLEPMIGAPLEVWKLPQPGEFYDVGVDIAGGASEHADWSVMSVFHRDTLEEVAQYRAHISPASQEFEDIVYWTGMAYNAAQINFDATGGWGHTVQEALKRRGYPAIYQKRRYDALINDLTETLGSTFTRKFKHDLVNNAVTLFYRGDVQIHSHLLVDEMENFMQEQTDPPRWGARSGCHDDIVIAMMLALLSARDERIPEEYKRPVPVSSKPWDVAPWAFQDVDEILYAKPLPSNQVAWSER